MNARKARANMALGIALSTPYGVSLFSALVDTWRRYESSEDAYVEAEGKRPTKRGQKAWGELMHDDGEYIGYKNALCGYACSLAGLNPLSGHYELASVITEELDEYNAGYETMRFRDSAYKGLQRILSGSRAVAYVW